MICLEPSLNSKPFTIHKQMDFLKGLSKVWRKSTGDFVPMAWNTKTMGYTPMTGLHFTRYSIGLNHYPELYHRGNSISNRGRMEPRIAGASPEERYSNDPPHSSGPP
ncbi:hypothetical protein O181_087028 [Austropuccinia psidii MF-1]|uniref:Uncharacterized protein n=1 Tax=Austropuccinia psidii MF-1 TaxID=1389203 RepID=A0A9Q3INX5_9BASI|nr:hypothetical protein [Austropuccinia psidii MF-1]